MVLDLKIKIQNFGSSFWPLQIFKSYNKSVDILQTGFFQRNAMEKTEYKSDLKFKKFSFWCWPFWFPLNLTTIRHQKSVSILNNENFIRKKWNMKKKLHQDWLKNKHPSNKNRQDPFWHIWAFCLFPVLKVNKKHKKELFNEHSTNLILVLSIPMVSENENKHRQHPFLLIWVSCFLCTSD